MKIIYVHQYFVTPQEGGATRSYHLARGMVANGIEVEMVTSHNKAYYDLRIIDGIKVHYLPVAYRQQFGFLRRVWAFLNFVRHSKFLISKLKAPDFFYISSTPLTTGLIGLWAKKKFAVPFYFEVRDLWPDAPIQVGAIRFILLKKILYTLEKRIYQHALKIIALSPGIAEKIRKKCPKADIHIISNFADLETLKALDKDEATLSKYGLKKTFTILYAGAIGKVNAVKELLSLARISNQKAKNYQFVVMGQGSESEKLIQKAKNLQLNNFFHFPFGSKEQVNELMSCADMAFISFSQYPILKTNSPNKFFDALACGKAVLVNHKGWVHELVKSQKLGIYYTPANKQEAFDKIIALAENPKKLKEMQQRSRSLALSHFSKEIAVSRLLSVIDEKRFGKITEDGAYILTA
ncbi:putative glycosyltransferase protein [Indibacter alkaliphilus LW1]|uniref:Glycosyltransferase protein n=1 Tax=Indibacter alkaliphilus (strain CCUG 57479 / KCTC 22604 / LW1) TaxID=1189612 RepID=S2DQB4_INDAL|nr:glycosyltransferase family 4 protein [Indibacter alkaliphilus]EOZ92028.1 putative glycosyltransferase protein [Indibacter alkaliphilus LW1]